MTPDAFGILALAITTALVAWPHVALSRLLRLRRPSAPPPPPGPSPSNQGAATGQPAPEDPVYVKIIYDPDWFSWRDADPRCSCAACARFDARVDAVMRAGRSVAPPA